MNQLMDNYVEAKQRILEQLGLDGWYELSLYQNTYWLITNHEIIYSKNKESVLGKYEEDYGEGDDLIGYDEDYYTSELYGSEPVSEGKELTGVYVYDNGEKFMMILENSFKLTV